MPRLRDLLVGTLCGFGAIALAPLRRRRATALARGTSIRSVLVYNDTAGVGNLILLGGLLRNIRRLYPGTRIGVVLPRSPLATTILPPALVDQWFFYDDRDKRPLTMLRFARQILRAERFDLGLSTFFTPTLLSSALLAVAGCRYRVGYARSQIRGWLNTITLLDNGGHELDRHLRLLAHIGQPLERSTTLTIDAASAAYASRVVDDLQRSGRRPLVGVHPGCDRLNALKRWPLERFIAVINRLVRDGADIAVFLGPDEEDLRGPLRQGADARAHLVAGESLARTAALVARCDAFVSNDSGLMHVAAALGVPVAAIFGPTSVEKNAPVGRAEILTAEHVTCRPCYTEPPIRCLYTRRHCLQDIDVERVVGAVSRLLEQTESKPRPMPVANVAVS